MHQILAPHHQASLSVLPNGFPNFFNGFDLQLFINAGFNDGNLCADIQLKVLHYVISSVNPNFKPSIILYRTLSSNEFSNQEFLSVCIMALKATTILINGRVDCFTATKDASMNASCRWLVNYMRNNAAYLNLDQNDGNSINQIDGSVKRFEERLKALQGNLQNQYVNQYVVNNQPMMNNQNITDIVRNIYQTPNTTAPQSATPYGSVPLNSGVPLNTLDLEANIMTQQPPPSQPVPINVTDTFVNPVYYEQPEQPPVTEPVKQTPPVQATTNTEKNKTFPDLMHFKGEIMDYKEHDLARLLRNGKGWGPTMGSNGSEVISALINEPHVPVKNIEAVEGEVTNNTDIGNPKRVIFSEDDFTAINDDDIRIILAKNFTAETKTIVTHFSIPEISIQSAYHEKLIEVFSPLLVCGHLKVAEKIKEILDLNEDPAFSEIIKIVDRRMCSIIVDKMNFELGLIGQMENYYESISSVLSYLKNKVNDISFNHINDFCDRMIYTALRGTEYGFLEDLTVLCLTQVPSSQFNYIIDSTNDIYNKRLCRINKMVVPELHKGIQNIFNYLDDIATKDVVRKVSFMTMDGAKFSIYPCVFTDCFNVVKETV